MTKHSSLDDETPTAETSRSETLREALDGPIDTKLRLIQHHAKMARLLAEEVLEEEVEDLAGKRHSRKKEGNPFRRWGSNSGSMGRRSRSTCLPCETPTPKRSDLWKAIRR